MVQNAQLCQPAARAERLREALLRRMGEPGRFVDLSLVSYFRGRFVAPPLEHQLAAARVRAADAVRSVWWSLEQAAQRVGGGAGWVACPEPLMPLVCGECGEDDHDPRDGHVVGGPCKWHDAEGDERCPGRLEAKAPDPDYDHDYSCVRCGGGCWYYAGQLTPWQMYERAEPLVAARQLARDVAHWERQAGFLAKRGRKPRKPRPTLASVRGVVPPVRPDLPQLEATHVLDVNPGDHSDGTRVLPIAEARVEGRHARTRAYLRGEMLAVPAWAAEVLANAEALATAAEAKRMEAFQAERAAEEAAHVEHDRALLASLEVSGE